MSLQDKPIDCHRHGRSHATFICRHLAAGSGLGFHRADDADDPRPDAWCDACDAVLQEEGEWNDRSETFAGVTLLCAGCYDEVRARNERRADAPHADGAGSPEALYLEHLDAWAGAEPRFYRISDDDVTPPVYTVTYTDTPTPGTITSFTLGLSSTVETDAAVPRKELVIAVQSTDTAWGLAVGYVAERARGRFTFPLGETVDFHAQVAAESAMSAFIIDLPEVMAPAVATRAFADQVITVVQLYPIYAGELRWIREDGPGPFLQAARRAQINWHDSRRPDLTELRLPPRR